MTAESKTQEHRKRSSFQDLKVWQEAMTLCRLVQRWEASAKDIEEPVRQRVIDLSIVVPARLAEGHILRGQREFINRIQGSLAALAELYTWFQGGRCGIPGRNSEVRDVSEQALKVMHMCGALLGYLQKNSRTGPR